MTDSFKKLKTKYFTRAIIISCAGGLCCALLVVGALLLGFKLGAVNFFWAFYIPIALAAFAIAGGLTFLFLRPTDVKVAKKLDKDNSLNEKIQTMIEYDGKEGDIVSLQREDADHILSGIKPKRPNLSFILSSAAACVLACAMFFTGVFVPARAEAGREDPPFIITNWQETALNALISDIRSSDLQTETKTFVLVSLEALLEMLKGEIPQSEMMIAVESVMDSVVKMAGEVNSYTVIAEQLSKDERLKDYAAALKSSAKSYGAGKELNTYQVVLNKREIITSSVNKFMKDLADAETENFNKLTQFLQWRTEVISLYEKLNSALEGVKGFDESDALYSALKTYAGQIAFHVDEDGIAMDIRRSRIEADGNTLAQNAGMALDTQSYTEMTCEFTRRRLAAIFGITITDPPEGNDPGNSDDPIGSEGPNISTGPGGHGGGTDDEIYDTGAGEYVKYMDVIFTKYYPAFDAILDGEDLPEETKARIREYLRALTEKIEDENSSGNQ